MKEKDYENPDYTQNLNEFPGYKTDDGFYIIYHIRNSEEYIKIESDAVTNIVENR